MNPADFDQHPQFKGMVLTVNSKTGAMNSNGGGDQIMAGFQGEYFSKDQKIPIDMKLLLGWIVNQAEINA